MTAAGALQAMVRNRGEDRLDVLGYQEGAPVQQRDGLAQPTPDRVGEEFLGEAASDLIFLFMGGFLLAVAMEHHGLHSRVALGIVAAVGTSPRRIVLGFMLAAGLLSMGISNTATAVMMLPIALSVVDLSRRDDVGSEAEDHTFALVLMLKLRKNNSMIIYKFPFLISILF